MPSRKRRPPLSDVVFGPPTTSSCTQLTDALTNLNMLRPSQREAIQPLLKFATKHDHQRTLTSRLADIINNVAQGNDSDALTSTMRLVGETSPQGGRGDAMSAAADLIFHTPLRGDPIHDLVAPGMAQLVREGAAFFHAPGYLKLRNAVRAQDTRSKVRRTATRLNTMVDQEVRRIAKRAALSNHERRLIGQLLIMASGQSHILHTLESYRHVSVEGLAASAKWSEQDERGFSRWNSAVRTDRLIEPLAISHVNAELNTPDLSDNHIDPDVVRSIVHAYGTNLQRISHGLRDMSVPECDRVAPAVIGADLTQLA